MPAARDRGRDDGLGLLLGEEAAEVIGIVAAIGDEAASRPDLLQQGPCDTDIVDVARRQQQGRGPALAIAQRVELARPTAARLADRLEISYTHLWTRNGAESTNVDR